MLLRHRRSKEEKKRKEQLQLEEEIAASMTNINVLKAGSSVLRRAASKGSDGIESHFRKGGKTSEALNTDAETFVPHKDGKDEKGQSILGNSDAHFRDGRPKQMQSDGAKYLRQGPSVLIKTKSTVSNFTAPPVSHHRDALFPRDRNGKQNNIMSIMEKQKEITAMLVQRQCLVSLPKGDIQILYLMAILCSVMPLCNHLNRPL